MCYLVREQQAAAAERGGATPPPSFDRLRPRWIGAAAAALIGGLAMAALVVAPPNASVVSTKDSTPPAPLASTAEAVPTAAVVDKGALPADDGVPGARDVVKAGMGDCSHGL